jgi:hypothetical protein
MLLARRWLPPPQVDSTSDLVYPLQKSQYLTRGYFFSTVKIEHGGVMLRILVAVAFAVFAVQLPSAARASSVQYDLTFTPTTGSIGGAGYFDVNTPVNGSGSNIITAFDVTIDGQLFTLANEVGTATADFTNGALSSLNYVGALLSGLNLDILGSTGLIYAYLDVGTGAAIATGTISATDPPPSATPLPGSMVLLASGLLGLLLLNYWRKKKTAWLAVQSSI